MIPLTVVVGLGGMGSSIAVGVRRRLLQLARERDRARGDVFEEKEIASHTRIFAVDTASDARELGLGKTWVLTPSDVNRTIARKMLPKAGEPSFQTWWLPDRKRIGEFILGAGAMRLKGKYAFYEEGWDVAEQIAKAVNDLLDVKTMMPEDTPPVLVFLVGSLSGGTGSGIMLPLALHLRETVASPNVVFIGAIPLASIMEKAPAASKRVNIWANCSAALRELEWWATPPERRPVGITPFLPKGQDTIEGSMRPFDLCYLFTENNRENRKVGGSLQEYVELVADAIALDINSDAAGRSLGSLSNFLQTQMEDREALPPLVTGNEACKPVTFGSMSAASLEYPVDSITRYLGLQLLDTALSDYLLLDRNLGTLAQDWATSQAVPQLRMDALFAAIRAPYTNPTTREVTQVGPRPGLNVEGMDRRNIASHVVSARKNFEDNWLKQLQRVIDLNTPLLDTKMRQALVLQVDSLLARPEGDGFAVARRFVGDLRVVLAEWRQGLLDSLNAPLPDTGQLNAERWPTTTRDRLQQIADQAVKELRSVCEGGPVRDATVQHEVARYDRQWWQLFTRASEQIALQRAVGKRYDALLETLDTLRKAFDTMLQTLKDARTERQKEASITLGTGRGRKMVLEERVLDHPKLVEACFGTLLTAERQQGAGSPVATLAHDMVLGPEEQGGLAAALHAALAPRIVGARPVDVRTRTKDEVARMLEWAENRFRPAVERLTIWQALQQEAHYRYNLNLHDQALNLVAPNGAHPSEMELWQKYVEQRVKQCLDSSAACWKLDTSRLSEDDFPLERDGVVWYANNSLDDLPQEDQETIKATVNALAGRVGLHPHPEYGSPHRLLAMRREAGAPLFMLDQAEQSKLFEQEKRFQRTNGTAYGDRRFVDLLPSDFELESVQAIFDRDELNRDRSPKLPQTWFEFVTLLNRLHEQNALSSAKRDEAMSTFGTMREALKGGHMSQDDYDEAVEEFLATLPILASA